MPRNWAMMMASCYCSKHQVAACAFYILYLFVCDEGNGDGWHDLEVVGPQTLEQRAKTLLTDCAA